MSDTDDTDLLLLIPPDFFLVPSSDLDDFDSDSDRLHNLCIERDELQDSVVSDLITQVNFLESRICMIENIDRSVTHCSTCNEGSFLDQSVNSLTESDILRAHIQEKKPCKSRETLSDDLMLKILERNLENGTDKPAQVQNHLSDLEDSSNNLVTSFHEKSETQLVGTNDLVDENISPRTHSENQILSEKSHQNLEAPLLEESHAKLLKEVDSFLEVKNKKLTAKPVSSILTSKSVVPEDDSNGAIKRDLSLLSDELRPVDNSFTSDSELQQSLALPEVYQLLQEMEETQHEIEKKLKLHESQQHFFNGIQEMSGITGINRSVGNKSKIHSSSQVLGLEDLYSKHSKPLFHKPTENVLERLNTIYGNKYLSSSTYKPVSSANPQVSYLFTQSPPVLNSDILSHIKDSKPKSVSPIRSSVNSHDPIESVKANLPVEGKGNNYQFGKGNKSPSRSTSFRRQLNFEKPILNSRSPRLKPLEQSGESSNNQVENQRKIENDKLRVNFANRVSSRSNHSLEDKFNSLTVHTQKTSTERVNQNMPFEIENKPSSSEPLQQRISSNNLLSLSELWNKEPTFYSDDPNKLRQKLEEEKYRRQHCEQQIQILQLRVLEEQEKLAVAVKVDQEKDRAILQITESWRKLNDHWSELEEQRHSLAQQLQEEKESAKAKSDELTKKIERWEKEVSQALDLAAGYKEKSEAVHKQMDLLKADTEQKVEEASSQLCTVIEENKKISLENENLSVQLKSFQERIQEEEALLSKLKDQLEKSNNKLSEYEAEVNVLKEQKQSLISKIKDEKNRSSILEQQKNALQLAVNEATKKEKTATEEARVSNERIEVARIELRALYQGQLETVVKEKLQEFQGQLEAAEAALKAELHSKEKLWIEKANDQCRQLQEKHKMELQRKEESHREEINKWKFRVMEIEKVRSSYESKLQEETNRRADIAQKLHSVMETQWREALNIISNPTQNVYEVPKDEERSGWPSRERTGAERLKGGGDRDLRASQSGSTGSLGQAEEAPFCKDGVVTYRSTQPPQDHQLKKYIQMLLERGPGHPIPHDGSIDQTLSTESSLQIHSWLTEDKKTSAERIDRLTQSSKPPWK